MRRSLSVALAAGLLLFSALSSRLSAQNPPPRGLPTAPPGPGEIRGRLVDSVSARPIGGGSITIRKATDSSFAGGTLVKEDGSFRVEGLQLGNYVVRIRTLGFAQTTRPVSLTPDKPLADLGTIGLKTIAAKLEAQEVKAEREETVVQPDRTVYSTKNMPAVTGGTTIDLLRTIPQVEVDANNRVSLRGNTNVVIQINGRPTPVKGDQLAAFLAQLPANTVKTVEVAANPSAKDDPEGTAGIINIVLNADTEVGLSGSISAQTGSTGLASGYGNIGKQMGKFVGFISANVYSDRRVFTGTISRENLVIATPHFVETNGRGVSRPLSVGGNLRSEYRFTQKNTLTLDAYYGGGHFVNANTNEYIDQDAARTQIGAFNQLNHNESDNAYQDWDLAFRRQGKPTEPSLTIESDFNYNWNVNDVNLWGVVKQSDPGSPSTIRTERDHQIGKFPNFYAKMDYSHPWGTKTKLDLGWKYQDRSQDNKFTASYLDPTTGVYSVDATRSTDFVYREHIGGAYTLLSRAFGKKIQSQLGTRFEEAETKFDLPLTNQHFQKRYASLYPSGVFTYNFSTMRLVRTSYSRRVTRPNPFMLNPVEFRQDSRNVFRGNPNIGAEYSDAVEVSIQDIHPWGSIQLNPSFRRTNNAVRNIQYIDATGVNVGTFANLAHNQTLGLNLNVNYRKGKFTGGANGGMQRYSSDARNLTLTSTNLSTTAFIWFTGANGTWAFNKKWDSQLFGNYRAPSKTEGGSSLAFVNMSFGLRYKRWGDQGAINVRVNDPFGLTKFGYKTANGQIVELSRRYFNARALYIGFNRNFGQALRLRAKSETEDNTGQQPTPP